MYIVFLMKVQCQCNLHAWVFMTFIITLQSLLLFCFTEEAAETQGWSPGKAFRVGGDRRSIPVHSLTTTHGLSRRMMIFHLYYLNPQRGLWHWDFHSFTGEETWDFKEVHFLMWKPQLLRITQRKLWSKQIIELFYGMTFDSRICAKLLRLSTGHPCSEPPTFCWVLWWTAREKMRKSKRPSGSTMGIWGDQLFIE